VSGIMNYELWIIWGEGCWICGCTIGWKGLIIMELII